MRRGGLAGMLVVALVATFSPAAAARVAPVSWSAAGRIDGGRNLDGIVCPSQSECLAFDTAGHVLLSKRLEARAADWRVIPGLTLRPNQDSIQGTRVVSCPSVSLCVVGANGQMIVSTDPPRASSWKATGVLEHGNAYAIEALSCPSVKLCVAVDDHVSESIPGQFSATILTTTNPAGGTHAWKTTVANFPGDGVLFAASCASISLCFLSGDAGIFWSRQPTRAGGGWNQGSQRAGQFLSCPSAKLCVAADGIGNLVSSSNPAGGAWRTAAVFGAAYVSCRSSSLCVGFDHSGQGLLASKNPTGGAASWNLVHLAKLHGRYFTTASCASSSVCLAVGTGGLISVGRRRPGA